MSATATAVIADDEPLLRAGLRAALAEAWPALEIVAEAANGVEVVNAVRELAAELDPRHFWQVHRGTIVNIRCIAAVNTDELGKREIALRDHPDRLEVSRTFAHLFKAS